jgi:hypothetical protein
MSEVIVVLGLHGLVGGDQVERLPRGHLSTLAYLLRHQRIGGSGIGAVVESPGLLFSLFMKVSVVLRSAPVGNTE